MHNDIQKEPFGLMEDVFLEKNLTGNDKARS